MNLAFARHFAGDLKHALGPIAEAHEIAARREPPDSHLRSLRRTYAVELSLLAGEVAQAERAIELTPYGVLAGPKRFQERIPWINRAQAAWLELEKGEAGCAEPELAEAVAKLEGWQMVSLAERYRLHLASALLQNGKIREAEAAVNSVVQHFGKREPRGLRMAQALSVLGEVHSAAGRHAHALEVAGVALSMLPASTGINSLNAAASFLRGKALLRLQRPEEALPILAAVDAYWRDFDAELPVSAEAAYWHGLTLAAAGDSGQGRRKSTMALARLAASPMPPHRLVVTSSEIR
jgi:tetratricopeptide (TPR) repeat protein